MPIVVPAELAASHAQFFGDAGRAWIAALPALADGLLAAWQLRADGPPVHGAVALVLPVLAANGTPAVLKLQPVDDETGGEPAALRAWAGDGSVRLLRHDPASGTMLLERLDATRTLQTVPDDLAALQTLSELLARLSAVAAPPGLRTLAGLGAQMLDRVPQAATRFADPDDQRLVAACAAVLADLLPHAGDRLLHWDLHFMNVLAAPPDRGGWLAIDPKPLAGAPGFELLAALHNRWDDAEATGDVRRAVLRRFDLMTEVAGLDRRVAAGWTLARVLQNLLWEARSGTRLWHAVPDRAVADALMPRYIDGS